MLFSTITTRGTFWTQARLKPSWNAPVEVAPSPIQVRATVGRPFIRSAMAAPTSTETMSPSIEITEGMLPSSESQPKCTFRSRPRVGPVARAMYWAKTSRGRPPRTRIAPRLRMRGVKMSPLSRA